jgi:hypothetical protein
MADSDAVVAIELIVMRWQAKRGRITLDEFIEAMRAEITYESAPRLLGAVLTAVAEILAVVDADIVDRLLSTVTEVVRAAEGHPQS